ncbi:GntR family transcriptional regulator [Leifsonia sp. McL0607]|uniref:GntR family transcriptional regulator n=1 Tax=Leifsonia sp. McL0607 TaxID=3415672 RepID=UPI003CF76752
MEAKASERAYTALREDIVEWRLQPGTVLQEVEQSERLGVSRTPVREALARLTTDGLVAAQGGRGLVVTAVSVESVEQLFELRRALEQEAARAAARNRAPEVFLDLRDRFRAAADLLVDGDPSHARYYSLVDRLDSTIDHAAANPYLVAALRNLRPHLARLRRVSRDDPDRLRAAAQEHLLIVEAIVEGDAELAASATRVHLYRSLQSVLASAERLISNKETP